VKALQKALYVGLVVAVAMTVGSCSDEKPSAEPAPAPSTTSATSATSAMASSDDAVTSGQSGDELFPMIAAQDLPTEDVLPGGESARFGDTLPVTRADLEEAYAGMTVACGPKPTKGLPEPTAATRSTMSRTFMAGGKKYLFDLLFLEFADPGPVEQLRAGLNGCLTQGGAAYTAYPMGDNRVMIMALPFES
jgi:hypothetical protein